MASVEATMNLYSDDICLCLCDDDLLLYVIVAFITYAFLSWPGLAKIATKAYALALMATSEEGLCLFEVQY